MITIFGRATSSNVQLVAWAAAELDVPFERLDYGHVFGGVDTPEYLAMNPNATVPTIKDGDLILYESGAILRYLGARYGDGGAFWPDDPVQRAEVDKWAEWGKINIALGFTEPIFWSRVRTAKKDRDEGALQAGLARFEAKLDILEAQLNGRAFVVGNSLTAADITIGHVLYRWFEIDVPRKPRVHIETYYKALTEREAFKKHVMVDFSVLAVKGH